MKIFLLLCFLSLTFALVAHEDHQSHENVGPKTWAEWVGTFHLIILHFPIALINMVAISELLFAMYKGRYMNFLPDLC